MKALKRFLIVGLAIGATFQTTAHAALDRTATLYTGTSYQWTGDAGLGSNVLYWDSTGTGTGAGVCSKDIESFCETTLIEYVNPVPDTDVDGRLARTSKIQIDWPLLVSDYDLNVYRSNLNGDRLERVGGSSKSILDADEHAPEQFGVTVRTTRSQPAAYFLIEVVYFAAVGGYTGSVTF